MAAQSAMWTAGFAQLSRADCEAQVPPAVFHCLGTPLLNRMAAADSGGFVRVAHRWTYPGVCGATTRCGATYTTSLRGSHHSAASASRRWKAHGFADCAVRQRGTEGGRKEAQVDNIRLSVYNSNVVVSGSQQTSLRHTADGASAACVWVCVRQGE